MNDKFDQFFSENDFDIHEPLSGHLDRFQQKLQINSTKKNNFSWKWLSVAASIVLIFGFFLGKTHNQNQLDLSGVSPKLNEVQTYFVSTINQELITLEKNRSLKTETIIEDALERLEELEDHYNDLVKELSTNQKQTSIINAMINNYQQRLNILENVLKQIESIKKLNTQNNEVYI